MTAESETLQKVFREYEYATSDYFLHGSLLNKLINKFKKNEHIILVLQVFFSIHCERGF